MSKPLYIELTKEEKELRGAYYLRPSTGTYHRKDGQEVKQGSLSFDVAPQPADPWLPEEDK